MKSVFYWASLDDWKIWNFESFFQALKLRGNYAKKGYGLMPKTACCEGQTGPLDQSKNRR